MPLVLALLASTLLHVAAVISPDWVLPDPLDVEMPQTIEAVLAKPPVRAEPVLAAKPVPKPVPKPPLRKPAQPLAAQPVVAAATPAEPPPATPAPVEEPPLAVPLAPTVEPAAPVAANTSLPGKGRMRYVITRGEGGFIIGQAMHSWEHDGFTYRLKSMTETIGIAAIFKPAQVFQSSQGEITDAGLRPHEFRHERSVGVDTASFDWSRHVVTYIGRQDILSDGTQDLLSMYYQLVLLAPRSGAVEMPIATGRKLDNYRFEVLGEETLSFPTGERRTMHLKTRSGKDNIDIWLSAGEGKQARSLPLKIRITNRKGEIYDQIADDLLATETK